MNTSKTKTAIIFMLITANLFFIVSTANLNEKKSKISSKMIDDTINILNSRNIIIDKDIIVKKIPSYKILEGEISKNKDADSNEIKNHVDIIKTISNTTEVIGEGILMNGGTLYMAGDYNFKFFDYNDSDTDNLFSLSIKRKDYESSSSAGDIDDLNKKIEDAVAHKDNFQSGEDINKRKYEKIINKFLKGYKYTKENYKITAIKKDKEQEKVCFILNQVYDTLVIENCRVYVEIYKDEVVYFGGNWYFGIFDSAYSINIMDSVNILLSISGKNSLLFKNDRLIKMEMLYFLNITQDVARFYMIPMWKLTFKSGKTHIFNSIDGEEFIKNPKSAL